MPAVDKNRGWTKEELQAPLESGETITPHATNEFSAISRGIWVGVGGNIAIKPMSGADFTLVGVPSGTLLPIRALAVRLAGTTASSLIALY